MISLLESVVHGVLDIPYLAVGLLVESLNGWVVVLGGILSAALAVLPGFPSIPTLGSNVLGGVAWFLPIGSMVAVFATFVAAWVTWMGVAIGLRWVKALG